MKVTTAEEFEDALATAMSNEDGVMLHIRTERGSRYVVIDME